MYGCDTIPLLSPKTKRMWTKDSSIHIPNLLTGLKVFGAITMKLIIIGVGCLLILYYPGKTIFKCVFYLMITLKVCDWKFIEESVFIHTEK